MGNDNQTDPAQIARHVQQSLPADGLFAGHQWRVATRPFPLDKKTVKQLEKLGRMLLKFYQATNMIYRWSAEGRLPAWPAEGLEKGQPHTKIDLQRHKAFRPDLPRVIRPDILLTEDGLKITELDSVPGGIGLTAWLNRTYAEAGTEVLGSTTGMLDGFAGIFGDAKQIRLIVSEESATYRPEMEWLAGQITPGRMSVHGQEFTGFTEGDAVYRFFELFDLPNIPAADELLQRATDQTLTLTAPPKSFLEEKMTFALFHNRNLTDAWRQQLGESFKRTLEALLPQTWVIDPHRCRRTRPTPGLTTNWEQLKELSQKDRNLILKISGFSEQAWARAASGWGAICRETNGRRRSMRRRPGSGSHPASCSVTTGQAGWMRSGMTSSLAKRSRVQGRVRLCPYYFVHGGWEQTQATLGGVLATICPADKKIIHGMSEAILAPCAFGQA